MYFFLIYISIHTEYLLVCAFRCLCLTEKKNIRSIHIVTHPSQLKIKLVQVFIYPNTKYLTVKLEYLKCVLISSV